MVHFFKDIFEYHHYNNQTLADLLLKKEATITPIIHSLYCHSINAHQIWNARILGHSAIGVQDLHPIEETKTLDKENLKNSLHILSTFDINQRIAYTNSKGKSYENSIQEILFHTANHFTHHRAQIMSKLKEIGIEPLVTDYIFYKR